MRRTHSSEDFEIQTDNRISARRPNQVIVSKKEENRACWIVDFAVPADYWVTIKETGKKDMYLDFQSTEEVVEHVVDGDTSCTGCTQKSHQKIGKKVWRNSK